MVKDKKIGPLKAYYFERMVGLEMRKWWSLRDLANEPDCVVSEISLRERLKRANSGKTNIDTVYKCMTTKAQNAGNRSRLKNPDTKDRDEWLDMMSFLKVSG